MFELKKPHVGHLLLYWLILNSVLIRLIGTVCLMKTFIVGYSDHGGGGDDEISSDPFGLYETMEKMKEDELQNNIEMSFHA